MAAEVVTAVAGFRAEVAANQAATMMQLARSYRRVIADTQRRATALANQIEAMRAAGTEVSVGRLVRMERYQLLLAQLRADVDAYGIRHVSRAVVTLQEENVWLAQQHAARIERIGLGDDLAVSLQRAHVLTPSPALQATVGLMGDGAPVREYLRATLSEATVDAVARAIESTVAGNVGPRAAAREVARATGVGLDRSLLIVRTETNRAYRESQRGRWADSGVVQAYRRVAARNERTCLGCIVMDGAVFPISEPLEDHPGGRCSSVPVFLINGEIISPYRGETARDWLEAQPEEVQRGVMGPRRWAAWKDGDVELRDMARRVEDPSGRFGGAWVPRTVADINETGAGGGRSGRAVIDRTVQDVVAA